MGYPHYDEGPCPFDRFARPASRPNGHEVADLATHPALRRITVETEVGPISLVAPPVIISDGPRALGPVPAIGSHSDQIRAEFA